MHVHLYCFPIVKLSNDDQVLKTHPKTLTKVVKGMLSFLRLHNVSIVNYLDMSIHNYADILNTSIARMVGLVVPQPYP